MSNIFVCVPTMNDAEFLSTVERCYDYAEDPDNLSIATTIFWKPEDINYDTRPFFLHVKNLLDKNFKKVKYDIKPWSQFPGVGEGRLSPKKHYNSEKYFLSIDSHTDFIDGWDKRLIDLYEGSRKTFGKRRVITSYLTPYKVIRDEDEFMDSGAKNTVRNRKDRANRWQFFDYYKNLGENFLNKEIFPIPNDKALDSESFERLSSSIVDGEYLPAKKISAHFYFTEADPWLTRYNLNLNKNIKFWGEEFYQSSLSYARGYNLVWCKTQVLFHYYGSYGNGRSHENFYKENFNSIDEKASVYKDYIHDSVDMKSNNPISSIDDGKIISNLLNKNSTEFGYLPRSISGFLKYSGIDIINRKTSPWWEVPEINVVYK